MPKIIAFYLPQFHEIEENNKWWGKGFTEWTNVKKGAPLYKGHYQPKVPLAENYYCLLDPKVQEWQSQIALENGIYGFCYYHYWFNGKLLLEKPMENMLNNPNVKIKFCISWANEPWTKTWTGDDQNVLMEQVYGGKEEWEAHLQYLLPFFQDKRYILKDNKPVFLAYRAESIERCGEMIDYWNLRLKEYGFEGIFFLETLSGWQREKSVSNSQGAVTMEPMHCFMENRKMTQKMIKKYGLYNIGILDQYDYDKVWNSILKKVFREENFFYGAFMNWDNTARKGKRATLIRGFSIEKYKNYMEKMYKKCVDENKEFLFFNAWNEWSEGTYLEPDDYAGMQYLETIKEIVGE